MAEYIPKSALVAEIKKLNPPFYPTLAEKISYQDAIKDCIDIIYTLEVKEVDLEKELDKEWNKCEPIDEGMGLEIASIEHEQFDNIAKHFFELGIAVSNKA